MFVEEGPRRHDGDKGESGTGKTDLQCQCDILCKETNEERDDLKSS